MRGEWEIDPNHCQPQVLRCRLWSTRRTDDRPSAGVASCDETGFVDRDAARTVLRHADARDPRAAPQSPAIRGRLHSGPSQARSFCRAMSRTWKSDRKHRMRHAV